MRCGAKAKGTGRPCRLPAGWGTDHPGAGRCKLHGGASLRKHGRRCSPEVRRAITEAHEKAARAMNMEDDVVMVRALRLAVLNKIDRAKRPDGGTGPIELTADEVRMLGDLCEAASRIDYRRLRIEQGAKALDKYDQADDRAELAKLLGLRPEDLPE